MLLITEQERADRIPTTGVYAVADLLGEDAAHATKMAADDLLRVIRQSVAPASWAVAGGHGVVVATGAGAIDVLLLRQTYSVHEELADLLDRLRELASLTPTRAPSVPGEPLGYTDAKRRVVRALAAPVSLSAKAKYFSDVIESLRDAAGIPILCDSAALYARNIASDTEVSGKSEGKPLKDVLEELLGRWRLVYVVEDGLLWITTAEESQRSFRVEVYPLGVTQAVLSEADLNELARKISSSVAPQSWHKAGGEGAIAPVIVGSQQGLVIRQSPAVHEQIGHWLATHGPR